MEQEKNKNGIIALLVVIIVILLALVILLATGTVSFKQDESTNNGGNNGENVIDSALLNNLYDVIGIDWESSYGGDCLNYFLSNNNYNDVNYKQNPNDYSYNAQRIFSLYASHNNMNTYRFNDYNCDTKCQQAYSCAECTSILKTNADKIKKLYNLGNLNLNELPGIDTDYAYSTGISVGVCHFEVTHSTDTKYLGTDSIQIIDKQLVTDYVWPEPETGKKINSTKNQTVTYNFKKDSNGNYYLDNVIVE